MEKIGLIVGNGKFPLYFIEEAKNKGISLYPIGLFSSVDEKIKKEPNYMEFNVGSIGTIVKYLLSNDIRKIVMLGKIEKKIIFENLTLDEYGKKMMNIVPDKKDETLLFAVIAFLRLSGIEVLPQNYLMKSFIFENKCYTNFQPTLKDEKTISIGIEAAKSLSKVDAGQTVVCRDMAVIALEGIEGTDETVKRAGIYSNEDNILIKMARPQQDLRVDVPVIGLSTIENIIKNGFKGVVAEAGKMMFLNQKECIELANKHNVFIVGKKI